MWHMPKIFHRTVDQVFNNLENSEATFCTCHLTYRNQKSYFGIEIV